MSEQQLYLAAGLPTVVALIGIMVNIGYFVAINARIGSLETRLDNRINSLEAKFDILVGKVVELANRLVRLEERLKH
jgi:hypothetical protein